MCILDCRDPPESAREVVSYPGDLAQMPSAPKGALIDALEPGTWACSSLT